MSNLALDSINSYNSFLPSIQHAQYLNTFTLNCQRVCGHEKFENLLDYFDHFNRKPDILCLEETWFLQSETGESNSNICLFRIPGYNSIFSSRTHRSAGIAMYVREGIPYDVISTSNGSVSFIHAKLKNVQPNAKDLYVTQIYMPRNQDSEMLLELFNQLLPQVGNQPHIILGDFNINIFQDTRPTREYINLFESHGYLLSNDSHATRPQGASNIDHVWSNMELTANIVLENDLSDHCGISTFYPTSNQENSPVARGVRQKINWNILHSEISRKLSSLNRVAYSNLNASDMIGTIMILLQDSIRSASTLVREKKRKVTGRPWISDAIIALSREKARLRSLLRSRPLDEEIKRKIKRIELLLKEKKQQSMSSYIDQNFNSGKSLKEKWTNLNQLLGRKKGTSQIQELTLDGAKTSDKVVIATEMNQFFVNAGRNLQNSIPRAAENAFVVPRQWNSHTFALYETNETEVKLLLSNLSTQKAVGFDDIPNSILKTHADELAWFIACGVNKSLMTGEFPDALKVARVVPIFKGGQTDQCGNYRPISVLTGINKVFEQVLHSRLSEFVEKFKILSETQFGFRKKSGTSNACVEVLEHIHANLDLPGNKMVSALFIDLKKAFDTISHDLLMDKLYSQGVRGIPHKLLKSYLTNRQQFVDLGENGKSPLLEVQAGVPQGSCLGPLLFLLFINDITELPLHGKIYLYADDAVILLGGKNEAVNCRLMSSNLYLLNSYLSSNLLIMNIEKTKVMHFHDPRVKLTSQVAVSIGDSDITVETVENFKYLGLLLDTALKWNDHCASVCRKINPAIAALFKYKNILPREEKYKIYASMVHSHISYVIPSWGSCAATHLRPLQVLQNRALKLVFGLPRLTSSVSLYTTHARKILPVKGLHIFSTLKYVKESMTGSTLSNVNFTPVQQERLRPRNALLQPRSNTKRNKQRISINGCLFFNRLPLELRTLTTLRKFVIQLKEFLLLEHNVTRFLEYGMH